MSDPTTWGSAVVMWPDTVYGWTQKKYFQTFSQPIDQIHLKKVVGWPGQLSCTHTHTLKMHVPVH